MINYPYICVSCGRRWETAHIVADRLKEKCSECGRKAQIDFSQVLPAISNWDKLYPVKITDFSPYPRDEHVVHSKKEHKELFKRYNRESPAFM